MLGTLVSHPSKHVTPAKISPRSAAIWLSLHPPRTACHHHIIHDIISRQPTECVSHHARVHVCTHMDMWLPHIEIVQP